MNLRPVWKPQVYTWFFPQKSVHPLGHYSDFRVFSNSFVVFELMAGINKDISKELLGGLYGVVSYHVLDVELHLLLNTDSMNQPTFDLSEL